MTEPTAAYRIVSRVHVNRWNEQLQTAEPGWDIRALWIRTGTVLPVFLPDTQYTPENVDRLVRHAGDLDDRMHDLGA